MPSIVDPAEKRGGAWAVTAGLIKAMKSAWPGCSIDVVAPRSTTGLSHRIRQAVSVAGSIAAGGLPAKMRFIRTRSMRRMLREAVERQRPALVVLNGGDVLWARRELPTEASFVTVVHNLEHALYRRQLANLPVGSALALGMLTSDARRLEAIELDGIRSADSAIFLSDEDLDAVRHSTKKAFVLPPLFDYEPHPRSPAPRDRLRLGMFADFDWWPNRVGLEWFIDNVWGEVSHRCELHLLGHGSERAARGTDGIARHGFVNDARDAFAQCDLMIAPITDGGGIKVKVAEALYNRVPVVATTAAVSRVFTLGNPALRICATPGEWIDFLTSEDARDQASQAVPAAVREAFSVEGGAKVLRENLLFLKQAAHPHS
jgi:glycosyltransferase involved in cell wall biosynthesis